MLIFIDLRGILGALMLAVEEMYRCCLYFFSRKIGEGDHGEEEYQASLLWDCVALC